MNSLMKTIKHYFHIFKSKMQTMFNPLNATYLLEKNHRRTVTSDEARCNLSARHFLFSEKFEALPEKPLYLF